ncbi:MAG: hypothetical protein DMG38_11355 [Acidobacteria bacterium]|nr:MAG: hypothetical protein DMG38_11355 [Acidobacteriota bacterium]
MKEKTSITLSKDLLAGVDRLAGSKQSRSAFIERLLRKYLKDRMNREAEGVLEYQASGE